MKGTARSLLLGSILISAIGFSACSDDTDENPGAGGTDTGAGGAGVGGKTGTGGKTTTTGGAAVAGNTNKGGQAGSGTGGAATTGGAANGGAATGGTPGAGAGGATAGSPGVGGAAAGSAGKAGSPGTGGAAAGAAGITVTAGAGGAAAGATSTAGTTSAAGSTAAAGSAGAAGAGNTASLILQNGDMEAATSAPWSGNSGTVAYDTTAPHGGTNALKVTGRTAAWNGPAQDLLPAVASGALVSGDIIYVSAWVKVSSATSKVAISLDTTDGTGPTYATGFKYDVNNTTWVKVSQMFSLIWDSTPTKLNLYFQTPDETTTFSDISIDDVTVVKVPNAFTNPGFENGTTGWSGNGGTLSAQSTVLRSGTASGLVTGRTNTWNGPSQDVAAAFRSGARVAFSAWVYIGMTTPAAVTIRASLDLSGTGADATSLYPEITNRDLTVAQVGTWVKLQTTWNQSVLPTWTILPQAKFYIQASALAADIYVDDVVLGVAPE